MTEEQAEELAAMAYKLGYEKGLAGGGAPAGDAPAQAEALKAQEQAAELEKASALESLQAQYASLMHAKNFQQALIVNDRIKALKAKQ